MAIDQRTPLAAFPDDYIKLAKKTAPNNSQLAYISQYNEYIKNKNFSAASSYLSSHPDLANCRLSTSDYNVLVDEIKAVEIYFKEITLNEIKEQLDKNIEDCENLISQKVGFDDSYGNVVDGFSGSTVSTFSSKFLLETIRNENIINLKASDWVTSKSWDNTGTDRTGIPENILKISMQTDFYYQLITDSDYDFLGTMSCFDSPIISPYMYTEGNTVTRWRAVKKNFGYISQAFTFVKGLLFVCYEKKPTADFYVCVKGK